jgi:uncharacterized protein
MLAEFRTPPGAPGVFRLPDTPVFALTGERMDVCGFAGVAPRGPVRVPVVDEHWRDDRPCVEPERPRRRTVAVPVESFDEYRKLFGGFEGPGLLPYALATFFEQGGRRAYVARIVRDYTGTDATLNSAGVSSGILSGATPAAKLNARSEGSWGDKLQAGIQFSTTVLDVLAGGISWLRLPADTAVGEGTLLRLTLPGGAQELRFVGFALEEADPTSTQTWLRVVVSPSLAAAPETAEVVEAIVDVDDGDGRREHFDRLGLDSRHPRWLATVLCYESGLIWPDASWAYDALTPDSVELVSPAPIAAQFSGGSDRYADIVHEDFFDTRWAPQNEDPGDGITAFAQLADLASLAVPDLYSPQPLPPTDSILDPVSVAGPDFERCVDLPPVAQEQDQAVVDLLGLQLDPASDLAEIIELQARVVDFAEQVSDFVALLDVPPGISHRQLLDWRAAIASSYAAAYHPWLQTARRDDSRDRLVAIPPSAVAAGIIARLEIAFGVPHGPANALAYEIVTVSERIAPAWHDQIHPLGIDVYLQERDGVRLTGARTLSRDAQWRQLSVRRLMIMLRRVLLRQMQWAVFEPNGPRLRARLTQLLRMYLRRLLQAGAFRGASEEQSFFVRCDDALNPPQVTDMGRLYAEIGVAPAEPLEFIVLRLSRDGDGTLTVEE